MEPSKEPISVRVERINAQILGKLSLSKEFSTSLISREGLLDAIQVLYDECNTDYLKNYDKNIHSFVEKNRRTLNELKRLRVNLFDFEVKNVIGRGNFGEVHMVKEKQTGDVYAMKTIKKYQTLQQKQATFEEERDIMAFSNSPWLTCLQYAFQDNSNLYFIMEYHPGGDLLSLLYRQGGTLPETAASFYIAELVLALSDLHNMGYVHRDIKPDNILLDRCGHLKLVDFGSATKLNAKGLMSDVLPVGTANYIAPEILQSLDNKFTKSNYGISSDYWSLGILAYELTIGNTPFIGQNTTATYSKIINHATNLKFPPDVVLSQAFVSLIKGLLTEQNLRFTYDDILKLPLYKNVDFNNLRDQVPPYVPKITSIEDTSNFIDIQKKKSEPHIDNFKTKTQFSGRNLPFIGFTYTQNTSKEYRDSVTSISIPKDEVVQNLKRDLEELQKKLIKNEDSLQGRDSLEKKLEEKVRKLESVGNLRDRLERDLANSIAECCTLKRTLDLERKDRADLERKALDLIKSTKLKWETSEKIKLESLHKEIGELQDRISKLQNENCTLSERLEQSTKLENKHKISFESVENLSRKSVITLESRLEKVTSETESQITELQSKLNEKIQENHILSKRNSEMARVKEGLQNEVEKFNEKYVMVTAKFEEALKTISCREVELAKLTERVDILKKYEKDVKVMMDTINELRNNEKNLIDINELKKEKELNISLLMEIESVKSEITFEKLSHEAIVEDLTANHKSTIKSLEDKLKDFLNQTTELEIKLNEAHSNDANNEIKIKTLEDLLVKLESGVAKLEAPVERETILQEQIKRLELQLAEVHENFALERQELLQVKSKYWRMEKDLKNAVLDRKIVERDFKEMKDTNNSIIIEMETLKTKLNDTKKVNENALLELNTLNENLADEILKLKDLVKKLENNLRQEQKKCDYEKNVIHELNTQIKNNEDKVSSLIKEIEMYKVQKSDVELQLHNHKQNYAKLVDQFERIVKEKSNLLTEIENYKREKHNNQLNRNALREACTLLENQLQEFETLYAFSEDKRQSLKAEVDKLTLDLSQAKRETQEARQSMNEEKSLKLLAETKCKKLNDDYDNIQSECEAYKKQCVDFKQYSNSLADELTTNEQKITDLEITLRSCERQIEDYTSENNILKEENSVQLTYINNLKESNYKFNQNLNELKVINDSLVERIEQLENTLSENLAYSRQRELKSEATIQQQTKLIDFLQSKIEESNKRKKTLSDKIFGSSKKENQPPISVVLNYKDLELQLNKEREVTKNLRQEILSLKSQLYVSPQNETDQIMNVIEQKKVLEQIVQSPASQKNDLYRQNSMQRMHHNIPHRFESKVCTKTTKCAQCRNQMLLGRHISVCRECLTTVHTICVNEVPRTCGLPQAYARHYSESLNKLENLKNTQHLQTKDQVINTEGWVKIPMKNSWEKYYACLTQSTLSIYGEPPNHSTMTEPIQYLDLKPTDSHGKVILEPVSSEIDTPVARSDLPFVIKVEVSPNTTCWPPKCLVFMTLGNEDKEKWYRALENIFSSDIEKYNGETILIIDMEVNCLTDLQKDVYLLGTEHGLHSFSNNTLLPIAGPLHVHHISMIPKINLALMIVDDNRVLISCDLKHLNSLCNCAPCTKPTLKFKDIIIQNMNGFHILNSSSVGDHTMLCIATIRQLVIMNYDDDIKDFLPERILDTAEPTSCILFTEHSLIIGADKFFEIDLTTYKGDEFLDISDVKLSHAIKCYKMKSFPLAIFQICKNPKEFLLCFHELAAFVDEFGRSSRHFDIKWNHLPTAFHYHNNYLYVVQFTAVEIIKITPNTCNVKNDSSVSLDVESLKIDVNGPKYLGYAAEGVYISSLNNIKLIKASAMHSSDISLISEVTEQEEESDQTDNSDRFSFTSSMVRSLDGNLSDAESVSTECISDTQRKVKFACITDL